RARGHRGAAPRHRPVAAHRARPRRRPPAALHHRTARRDTACRRGRPARVRRTGPRRRFDPCGRARGAGAGAAAGAAVVRALPQARRVRLPTRLRRGRCRAPRRTGPAARRSSETMITASLTARRRARELDELASGERVDVLVVGGGVTGVGCALDAAPRGLSVALVEAHDLAFGTSRWSSKLVHGGLRYLAHGEFGLAHESAVERDILMTRTAPHLTRSTAQVFPAYGANSRASSLLTRGGL